MYLADNMLDAEITMIGIYDAAMGNFWGFLMRPLIIYLNGIYILA